MNPAHTLSVSIARKPEDVARYVADPRNLPQWAGAFCKSVQPEGDTWRIRTEEGEFGVRFNASIEHGILDHTVELSESIQVYVPMRVVANGEGSEVLFTLFRMPGMTSECWQKDIEMVTADLEQLRKILEGTDSNEDG